MDDPRTDEALMLAYRDGDAAAFEALYGRWRGRLYRYLAHQAADRADELFQDGQACLLRRHRSVPDQARQSMAVPLPPE